MQRDEVVIQDIINAARLVIGEAVKRLSKEFRAKYPEIPWTLIAGMRDNLIHGYDLIDWDEVWKTSTVDVPDLLVRMESFTNK